MWGIGRKESRNYGGDLSDNASAGMNRRGHNSAANAVGEDPTNVPEINLEPRDGAWANYDPEEQRDEVQRERAMCRGEGGGRGRDGRRPGGEEHRNRTYNVKRNMWTGGVFGKQREFSKSECVDKGGIHKHQAAEVSDEITLGIMRGRRKQRTEGQDVYITRLLELNTKDSRTLVTMLSADSHFASILNQITVCSPTVYVVARVLAKACGDTSVPGDVVKVLLAVAESRFFSHATATLQETMQNPHGKEENTRQFIRDLLIFLIELSNRLPHSYITVEILGLESSLKMAIDQLDQVGNIIDEDMHLKMTELLDIKPKMVDNTRSPLEGYEENPPNDFREISIFPTDDDIYPNERPFLQKNIDVGKYRDLDQYLDVQFRLMREDYISPLRDGIADYLQSQRTNQEVKDITVYHDVHVIRSVCLDGGVFHRVKFDVSKLIREDWDNSKRLMHSSLVCLSPDNFVTLLFATVLNRDSDMLCKGIIDLLFENYDGTTEILAKESNFEMVESPTFFEAYRHVLQALQTVKPGDFPFEKYIVHCNIDVDPPKYLRLEHGAFYDLRPLVADLVVIDDVNHPEIKASYQGTNESTCAKDVEVCDYSQWPSAEQLKLDTSQYKAVQTALTKEFAIIQGPPGTGKTFIGLTIVKALLHNAHMWSDEKNSSPMLIVCYTNHALDQFLEGVVSFFKGDVLRVGSRMDSQVLVDCSMEAHRQKAKKIGGTSVRNMKEISRMKYDCKVELLKLMLQTETLWQQIERAKCMIIHEDILRPVMKHHYDCMMSAIETLSRGKNQNDSKKNLSVMVKWLHINEKKTKMYNDTHQVDYYDGKDKQRLLRVQITELQRRNYAYDVLNLNREPGKQQLNVAFKHPKRVTLTDQRLKSGEMMTENEAKKISNLWNLNVQDRWRLYRYWACCFTKLLRARIVTIEDHYRDTSSDFKRLQVRQDKEIMRNARVIGMTTTCAARYQRTLSEIGPKIVIVEEAAEVLEGHTVTSLSKKCEHLILIGDHKQLKPNPAVYRLAKKFNLDLSLFERMVNNGIPCDTLALQHRMRPEISNLMKKIYPDLQNHPSVFDYESMKGVSSNVFFVSHGHIEGSDVAMRSHSNTFEAEYVVSLCVYFVKQGYDPSKITVLTTYSGQLRKLKQLMPKHLMRNEKVAGVTVKVVDNYQGEENDIILLSLVRSNAEGKVGFMKIENRICVALSRAKKGLFVIGNFNLLAKESLLWKEIIRDLERNNMIGTTLSLYCQNHPQNDGIDAKSSVDFRKAPEGGCMKKCLFRLDCGHRCRLLCHPKDPQHTEYKCKQPCPKTCSNNHQCLRLCYDECGDCLILVEKTIPMCGHTQELLCYIDPREFNCMVDCENTLKCGHKQMLPCHEDPREFNCMVDCEKALKCGHKQMLPCHEDPMECTCMLECEEELECGHICGKPCGQEHECTQRVRKTWVCGHSLDVPCPERHAATCTEPCSQVLRCGHTCRGTCHTCHGGRLHLPCNRHYLTETLVCGHRSEAGRSVGSPCEGNCENSCIHRPCLKTCGAACLPCNKPCAWRCLHHACTKECNEPCNRPPCDRPCMERVRCGHRCIGLCGERCPRLCRVCDRKEVTTIRFGGENQPDARFVELEDCGHIVEVSAMDKHMSTTSDNGEIRLKACPICKKAIRWNFRYGYQIKDVLGGIERVKNIHMVRLQYMTTLKAELEKETSTVIKFDGTPERSDTDLECNPTAIVNQLTFLKSASTVYDAYKHLAARISAPDLRYVYHDVILNMEDMNTFIDWLKVYRLSFNEQQVGDAQNELLRHKAIVKLLSMETFIKRRRMELNAELSREFAHLKDILKGGKPYTVESQGKARGIFQELRKKLPLSGIEALDEEIIQTVKETTFQAGHWFKCPEGHIYELRDRSRTDERCHVCRAMPGSDEGDTYRHARGVGTGGHVRTGHTDTRVRGRDTDAHPRQRNWNTHVSGQNTESHVHLRDTNTNTHARGRDTQTKRRGTDPRVRRTSNMDTHSKDKRINTTDWGTDPYPRASNINRRDRDTHPGGNNKQRNSRESCTDTHMRGTDIYTDVKASTGNTDTHARGKDMRANDTKGDTDAKRSTSNTNTHARGKEMQTNWRRSGTDTRVKRSYIATDARNSTSNTNTHARGKEMQTNWRRSGTDTRVKGSDIATDARNSTSNTNTHARGKEMQTNRRRSGSDTRVKGSGIATDARISTMNTDKHAREKETQTNDRKGATDTCVRGKDVDTHVNGSAGITDTHARGTKTQTNGNGNSTDTYVRGRDRDADARGRTSNTDTHANVKDTQTNGRGSGTDTHVKERAIDMREDASNAGNHARGKNTRKDVRGRGTDVRGRNTDTEPGGKNTRTNAIGSVTETRGRGRDIDTEARGTDSDTDTQARGKDTRTNTIGSVPDTRVRERDTYGRGSTANTDIHATGKDKQTQGTGRGTDPHPRARNIDTDERGRTSNTATHTRGKDMRTNMKGRGMHGIGKEMRIHTRGRGLDPHAIVRNLDTDTRGSTANMDIHARGKDTQSQTKGTGRGTDPHSRARNIDTDTRGRDSDTETQSRDGGTRR